MKTLLLAALLICYHDDGIDALQRACNECKSENVNVSICNNILDTRIAYYLSREDRIYLNLQNPYWKNTQKNQKIEFDTKWMSSSNPDHVIWHEIAHSLLYRRLGPYKYVPLDTAKVNLDPKVVEQKVSKYANHSVLEFFSEVYAGLRSGKKYSDEIMKEYNAVWNL